MSTRFRLPLDAQRVGNEYPPDIAEKSFTGSLKLAIPLSGCPSRNFFVRHERSLSV